MHLSEADSGAGVMSEIEKGLAFILLQLMSVMERSLVVASICHDLGSGLFGSLI